MWQRGAGGRLPLAIGDLCPGNALEQADGISVVGWGMIDGLGIGGIVMQDVEGQHQEADIILDSSWFYYSDEQCLLSVLLHEFGHALGLAHQDNGLSIMLPTANCRPALSDADIAAVRFLYP